MSSLASGAPALSSPGSGPLPARTVVHADALGWLRQNAPLRGASVITSLPDASEVPALGFEGWRRWFVEAASAVVRAVGDDGAAIFFQSDVRRAGRWIDKGALVTRAAEDAGMHCLFHKIVCRRAPGTVTVGRASYSHLLGFARTLQPSVRAITADVLPEAGFASGPKAMGAAACLDAVRFVLEHTTTRTVVDPFCGFGTVLAVANALGLDAIGVDLSARMCRRARALDLVIDGRPAQAVARPARSNDGRAPAMSNDR